MRRVSGYERYSFRSGHYCILLLVTHPIELLVNIPIGIQPRDAIVNKSAIRKPKTLGTLPPKPNRQFFGTSRAQNVALLVVVVTRRRRRRRPRQNLARIEPNTNRRVLFDRDQ